ncbi:MAG: hypothetical protein NT179_07455 [Nitrospirae bacterium]|nr:hypothetical protein [Nitrospirota bacterium]
MSSDSEDRKKEDREQAQQAERVKDHRDAWDRPEKDLIQKVEAPNPWPDPPPRGTDKNPDRT